MGRECVSVPTRISDPKVVAGHRAISPTLIMVTAKSEQKTQKMPSTHATNFCARLLRRRSVILGGSQLSNRRLNPACGGAARHREGTGDECAIERLKTCL